MYEWHGEIEQNWWIQQYFDQWLPNNKNKNNNKATWVKINILLPVFVGVPPASVCISAFGADDQGRKKDNSHQRWQGPKCDSKWYFNPAHATFQVDIFRRWCIHAIPSSGCGYTGWWATWGWNLSTRLELGSTPILPTNRSATLQCRLDPIPEVPDQGVLVIGVIVRDGLFKLVGG
jgi:hypothetical protein